MINKNNYSFKIIKKKNFSYEKLIDANFKKAKLKSINFSNSSIIDSDFWLSEIKNCNFSKSQITNSVFSDVDLRKAKFDFSKLVNCNLSHTDLRGMDFKNTLFKNINLRDAIYDHKTKWPKKFNPKLCGAVELKKNTKKKSFKKNYQKKVVKVASKEIVSGKGYFIIKNLFSKKQIDEAEKIILKKSKSKINLANKRKKSADKKLYQNWVYHLFNKGKVFREMAQPKILMQILKNILGPKFICGAFEGNLLLPGARGQKTHIDYPYYNIAKPGEKVSFLNASNTICCVSLILLTDFNKLNGATRFIPRSQKFKKFPTDNDLKKIKKIRLEGKRGDLILFNGLCWHGAESNLSNKPRIGILGQYLSHFIKPKYNELSTLKKKIINKSSSEFKQLLGAELKSNYINK